LLNYSILDGNGNQERFRQFLHGVQAASNAAHLLNPIVVMDNVAFHKTEMVREEMVILNLIPKCLPPYSPFFNPIENMFSQWKNFVKRSHATNEQELLDAMNQVHNHVTIEHCNNYFAKIFDNCYKCAHYGVDIFDN
jgi:transposase